MEPSPSQQFADFLKESQNRPSIVLKSPKKRFPVVASTAGSVQSSPAKVERKLRSQRSACGYRIGGSNPLIDLDANATRPSGQSSIITGDGLTAHAPPASTPALTRQINKQSSTSSPLSSSCTTITTHSIQGQATPRQSGRVRASAQTPSRSPKKHPPTRGSRPLSPIPASPPNLQALHTASEPQNLTPKELTNTTNIQNNNPLEHRENLSPTKAACALATPPVATPHRLLGKTSAGLFVHLSVVLPPLLYGSTPKFDQPLQILERIESPDPTLSDFDTSITKVGLPAARVGGGRRPQGLMLPDRKPPHDMSALASPRLSHISDEPLSPRTRIPIAPFASIQPGQLKSPAKNRFGFRFPPTPGREEPPTPPAKDSPTISRKNSAFGSSDTERDGSPTDSYFNKARASRAGSIYTLGRASFTNQISQLTSVKLPDATSLSSTIVTIPTSTGAAKALNDVADEIRVWIHKSSDVLANLDAEDDVEWAAAGGRDGIGEVDAAISRFEALIDVYVSAVEQLEQRPDITAVSATDLNDVVQRMEKITSEWTKTKNVLQGVRQQAEIAMEWEEFWNNVLGDISQELDALNRLIFEMEERRHKTSLLDPTDPMNRQLDFSELETIVEESPSKRKPMTPNNRLSIMPTFTLSEQNSPAQQEQQNKDASNLMSLFARMQPLRASLDFLPMQLSPFLERANTIFPSACDDLTTRKQDLETKYDKLSTDAENLRKELGEDRWVITFRKAGSKTLKMCESVERSILKLRDDLDEGTQFTNPAAMVEKISVYEKKKEHYSPAIQRVIGIIDKGVQSRSTFNGEILRLQEDLQRRWTQLEAQMKGMDFALEQLNIRQQTNQSLRDSVSTIFSAGSSTAGTTIVETPSSSPASSIIYMQGHDQHLTPQSAYTQSRKGSFANTMAGAQRGIKSRLSSLPTPGTLGNANSYQFPRKTPLSRSSASELRSPPPTTGDVTSRLYTPTPVRSVSRLGSNAEASKIKSNKPRWNGSTVLGDTVIGHNFKPLSAGEPSPYAKEPVQSQIPQSRMPRPASRAVSGPGPASKALVSPLAKTFSSSVHGHTTAGASALPYRPGSSLARPIAQRPLTPPRSMSKLRAPAPTTAHPAPTTATSKLQPPKSHLHPAASHPTLQKIKSSMPRASMYFSPAGAQRSPDLNFSVSPPPASPPLADTDTQASSHSRSSMEDSSPTAVRTGSRLGTSMMPTRNVSGGSATSITSALPKPNKRLSLLPQPSSGTLAASKIAVPSTAGTTRTASRAGSRLSFGLGQLASGRRSSLGGVRHDEEAEAGKKRLRF